MRPQPRHAILLRAALDTLHKIIKCDEEPEAVVAFYDETDCCPRSLIEDIATELGLDFDVESGAYEPLNGVWRVETPGLPPETFTALEDAEHLIAARIGADQKVELVADHPLQAPGIDWFVVDKNQPRDGGGYAKLSRAYGTSEAAGVKREWMEATASDSMNERWNLAVVWEESA